MIVCDRCRSEVDVDTTNFFVKNCEYGGADLCGKCLNELKKALHDFMHNKDHKAKRRLA